MPSTKLTLHAVAKDYWRRTRRGRESILAALRDGRLKTIIHFPFNDSECVVPPKVWESFPDAKFRVRYKKKGKWMRLIRDLAINAEFAVHDLFMDTMTTASTGDLASKVGPNDADLHFLFSNNYMNLNDNQRCIADAMRLGAYLAGCLRNEYVVYVRGNDYEQFIIEEESKIIKTGKKLRKLKKEDLFWLEMFEFLLRTPNVDGHIHLLTHMEKWGINKNINWSSSSVKNRVIEARRVVRQFPDLHSK